MVLIILFPDIVKILSYIVFVIGLAWLMNRGQWFLIDENIFRVATFKMRIVIGPNNDGLSLHPATVTSLQYLERLHEYPVEYERRFVIRNLDKLVPFTPTVLEHVATAFEFSAIHCMQLRCIFVCK